MNTAGLLFDSLAISAQSIPPAVKSAQAGGQTVNLDTSTESKDAAGSWSAVDNMNTPMGAATRQRRSR